MRMKIRLERVEKAAACRSRPDPAADRCPTCQSDDLAEPREEEWLTLAAWSYADLMRADEELRQSKARLAWGRACQRLVAIGTHDPDWQRQFWEGCEGSELRGHIRCLSLLRAAMTSPWEQET